VLAVVLLLFIFWQLWMARTVYQYSFVTDPHPADAAIVMGAAAWHTRPSPVFAERINHAITLYRNGRVEKIIFTGGTLEPDERADSEVAANYASQRGVQEEDMYCELISRTTFENLHAAKSVIQEQGIERVLLVSDPIHMKRVVAMARDLGLDAHPSPTPTSRYRSWWSRGLFLLRESYNYGTYLLLDPPDAVLASAPELETSSCG
jgi:uncharacterized SAM-binding protein YcdF (DUF218 family)